MNNQEMLRELEHTHRNIGGVIMRVGIQKLLDPNWPEIDEQVAEAEVSLARIKEMRLRAKRRKDRRL
jgi:uncharacterized protein with von Willebrand factor type A (vWA) domain